ncbi:hypothetical protein E1281_35255 [Actinomadura sp. KC345]|uniref:hypothetical protein n=1 Tax=Actinomadura sp. KC345 TaxID=2530371 RepID=UPI0010442AE7|nr:hypothetical protein [Actinomadura sp. KC345]TDC43369.1 hypothetical protein E1281_35255 [Actinomadura sp. KC345]
MRLDHFGPVEKLHAALRRRAPQVAVAVERGEQDGFPRLRVTYRHLAPLIVAWDGTTYRYLFERGDEERLPADPEKAADRVAGALGARVPVPAATEERP